jgi:hypothetical protein
VSDELNTSCSGICAKAVQAAVVLPTGYSYVLLTTRALPVRSLAGDALHLHMHCVDCKADVCSCAATVAAPVFAADGPVERASTQGLQASTAGRRRWAARIHRGVLYSGTR